MKLHTILNENLQAQWQPAIDKIKAHAKKHNFDVTRYELKADQYGLILCVGRDNPTFDEGAIGDDVILQYADDLNLEVAANTTGPGVERLRW